MFGPIEEALFLFQKPDPPVFQLTKQPAAKILHFAYQFRQSADFKVEREGNGTIKISVIVPRDPPSKFMPWSEYSKWFDPDTGLLTKTWYQLIDGSHVSTLYFYDELCRVTDILKKNSVGEIVEKTFYKYDPPIEGVTLLVLEFTSGKQPPKSTRYNGLTVVEEARAHA